MKIDAAYIKHNTPTQKVWLFSVFMFYLIMISISILHHELWGDEVHSWNIAKASANITELFSHIKYEGHPPVWYLILYSITKFTHNPQYMQWVHVLICGTSAFLLLFYSRFSFLNKILILNGYYFLYEYAVVSRNYSFGVLVAFILCIIIFRQFKYKNMAYYGLLLVLSNTHLLALILAISFHAYFFSIQFKEKRLLHIIVGIAILLPAIYFILPPSNNNITPALWEHMFSKQQFLTLTQVPTKSFLPIPAWWLNNFWNIHFLVEEGNRITYLNYVIPFISLFIVTIIIYILWPNKKSLGFFLINMSVTVFIGFIFPLNSARYVGYVFISFIMALWLFKNDTPSTIDIKRRGTITVILSLQLIGAAISLINDWNRPFSQINKIAGITLSLPSNERVITDFWCLNYLTASLDKPFYCVGFKQKKSFLTWDSYSTTVNSNPHLYMDGINAYLLENRITYCYVISNNSLQALLQREATLTQVFKIEILAEESGAIEKYSNIYAYKFELIK